MKRITLALAILTLIAIPVLAGEWHTGQTNLCADCHTMHNSMAHSWDNVAGVTSPGPSPDGNWVGATGPAGDYLLKAADPNALCLACHDGAPFAPDVVGANFTNGATNRAAGYLNMGTMADHTGHTLGSTDDAPGDATLYTPGSHGLECINCHTQHGRAGIYRNLGPRTAQAPTYTIDGKLPEGATGGPTTLTDALTQSLVIPGTPPSGGLEVDIFINATGYTPNSGDNFKELYETANISYLKRGVAAGEVENRSGNQCAACHSNFHGSVTSANLGGEVATPASGYTSAYDQFNRHPVGVVIMGSLGGGHSDPVGNRYAAAASVSRVKTYADDQSGFTDASPGCISCHKAHGNGQPFGLIFANRTVAGMTEEGTMAANATPTGAETAVGQRALCGQCHRQGN